MKKIIVAIMLVCSLLMGGLAMGSQAFAKNDFTSKACDNADATQKAALGCDKDEQAPKVVTNIINAVISVVGIVAVLVIVVAGQRYITSNGDPTKLQQARNMIIYGLIGVIIALLAFAIVNFVLGSVFS